MLSRNSECVTGASDTGYRPTVLAATDGGMRELSRLSGCYSVRSVLVL